MINNNRSLAKYFGFGILTCGIYMYYFIYKLAEDMNCVCAGDGEETSGLLKFILLSIVTCGIYSFYWYYKVGNRMQNNAPRYGLSFQENGTTILLWQSFGTFLCGIGAFVAINIICKNMNALATSYNVYVSGKMYQNMNQNMNQNPYQNQNPNGPQV